MNTLTLNSAKAYAIAEHTKVGEAADVEGAGFINADTVRLNVIVRAPDGSGRACQWDVYEAAPERLHGFYMA